VDTDVAEVESEARPEEGEVVVGKRLSGRAQDLVDERGRFGVRGLCAGGGNAGRLWHDFLFLFAVCTFAADAGPGRGEFVFFLLAVRALAADLDGSRRGGFLFFFLARGAFALDLPRIGGRGVSEAHAHHLIGDAVCFPFQGVGKGANPELGLKEPGTE
jgi:hypothetical protein